MNKVICKFAGYAVAINLAFVSYPSSAGNESGRTCNAAETAKVCKDYDPEYRPESPELTAFYKAKSDCVGTPYDSDRHNACTDDPRIEAMRVEGLRTTEPLKERHTWMKLRCDKRDQFVAERVCGSYEKPTSPLKAVVKGAEASKGKLDGLLTRSGPTDVELQRKATKEAKDKADAKARDAAAMAKSSAQRNAGITPQKPTGKACKKGDGCTTSK